MSANIQQYMQIFQLMEIYIIPKQIFTNKLPCWKALFTAAKVEFFTVALC